jgi:hypothetical protein
MEWTEIKTNDKMNQTLKDCLEMQKDNISLYARKYIEELECEVKKLSKADVIKSVCDCEPKTYRYRTSDSNKCIKCGETIE